MQIQHSLTLHMWRLSTLYPFDTDSAKCYSHSQQVVAVSAKRSRYPTLLSSLGEPVAVVAVMATKARSVCTGESQIGTFRLG